MSFGNISGLGFGNQNSAALKANYPTNLYVDGALGSDSNPGTYDSPFETLQYAIDIAALTGGHNNILIFEGVYDENPKVNDEDSLTLRGLSNDPYKVIINGHEDDVLTIQNGPRVELYNLRFTNGRDGVTASDLSFLKMHNIASDGNFDDGLQTSNVDEIYVSFSRFIGNMNNGAEFLRSNTLYISDSWSLDNGLNGIEVNDNEFIGLLNVSSKRNGFEYSDRGENLSGGGSGVAGYGNSTFLTRGGAYFENFNDGILIADTDNTDVQGTQASHNGNNGLESHGFEETFIAGGIYEGNGNNGIFIDGEFYEERAMVSEAVIGNGKERKVTVRGSLLWDNGDDGFEGDNFETAFMTGLDVRRNSDDGINLDDIDKADVLFSYADKNGDDGAEFDNVTQVNAQGFVGVNNGEDGFDVDRGTTVRIYGGLFDNNVDQGIDLDGSDRMQSRADVIAATANGNSRQGLHVDGIDVVEVKWGGYRDNGLSGIEIHEAMNTLAFYTGAENNGRQGLYYVGGGDNFAPRTAYQGPYTWSGIQVSGGVFNQNDYEGIKIIASDSSSYHTLDAKVFYATAVENGSHGLMIGAETFLTRPEEYGGGGSLTTLVDTRGGYYALNDGDGINLTGSNSSFFYSGKSAHLDASVADAVSELNQNNGLTIFNSSEMSEPNDPPLDNGFGGSLTTYATIDRGFYGFNGYDGINISAINSQMNGFPRVISNPESPLQLNHVVSRFNGGHGVGIEAGEVSQPNGPPPGRPGALVVGNGSDPLISIIGGNYSFNDLDGVSLFVANTFEEPDNMSSSGSVYLQDVVAEFNGWSGLAIYAPNFEDETTGSGFGPDVDIIGGNYNLNAIDGISLTNLGYVFLDGVTGVSNDDDGLDSFNSFDVDINNSTFVDNSDQDIVIV